MFLMKIAVFMSHEFYFLLQFNFRHLSLQLVVDSVNKLKCSRNACFLLTYYYNLMVDSILYLFIGYNKFIQHLATNKYFRNG